MNDKITTGVQLVNICCPYRYLCLRNAKRDTNKRLAREVGVSEKAIEWNKKKFREGKLVCLRLSICQEEKPDTKK